MPRYYLHICNGNGFTEDQEGQDLPSVESAREKAIAGLRDIMADELKGGVMNMASFIEIEDESRQLVETISFHDAVYLETRGEKRPAGKAAGASQAKG